MKDHFIEWLSTQTDRKDVIGNLASELNTLKDCSEILTYNHLWEFINYLCPYSKPAFKALFDAKEEFGIQFPETVKKEII